MILEEAGILTVTLTPLLRVRVAFLGLLAGLCFLTACGSKQSAEATGMGNSRETARQDAIRTLDRKYASYEIVDENASDWVSGHAQVKDPDRFGRGATTQEQVRTYKCSIRVKNAVPRKEGDTTTQVERKAQAAEAVIADAYKKESVKIEGALNTELGQQTKAPGMICLITYDKVDNQISVSEWKERVRKTTGLQELATKYDLRILDDPQPTEQENRNTPPVAYIFSTGVSRV